VGVKVAASSVIEGAVFLLAQMLMLLLPLL
jgi:hypothetical protein